MENKRERERKFYSFFTVVTWVGGNTEGDGPWDLCMLSFCRVDKKIDRRSLQIW